MMDDDDKGAYPAIVSEAEWVQRKRFVGFGPADEKILRELHLLARSYADEVMDELYRRWLHMPELQRFFPNDTILRRVKALQRQYFISLTEGEYGAAYLAYRLQIGRVHQRIGLSPRWYMGAYTIYLDLVLPKVMKGFEHDRTKQIQAVTALMKIISLDQELALVSYFSEIATST